MDLQAWYHKYGRIPLIISVSVMPIVLVIYTLIVVKGNWEKYRSKVDGMVQTSQIALMQKNRVMLEAMFNSLADSDLIVGASLCHVENSILSFPPYKDYCKSPSSSDVLIQTEIISIAGFSDYQLMIASNRIKVTKGLAIIFFISTLVTSVAFVMLGRFSRKFEHEILWPIVSDFQSLTPGIAELNALKEQRDRLLQLERESAKAALAKQIAHDIRSPLSALQLFQAQSKNLSSSEAALVNNIVDRIGHMANDLLEKSRNLPKPTKIIDLQANIKNLIQASTLKSNLKGVRLELDLNTSTNIEKQVQLVPNEFDRVLNNLLENALDATPRNGTIKVSEKVLEKDWCLFVEDSGPGLKKHVLDSLDAGVAVTTKPNGNGLGLSHAYSTIKTWLGSITYEQSNLGGAMFKIQLPVIEFLEL